MEPGPGAARFGGEAGDDVKPYFWIHACGRQPVAGAHIAFAAADHGAVDAFHAAALAAGGTDNGAPRPAPALPPSHCGAFALDPDGNNVEAVCHRAPD